eukprot:Ihof_evm11s195 gene=Ihof_evmTU11s195
MDDTKVQPRLDGQQMLNVFVAKQPARSMAMAWSAENCIATLLSDSIHLVWLGSGFNTSGSSISCTRETISLPPPSNYTVAKKVVDKFYDYSSTMFLEPTLGNTPASIGFRAFSWSPIGCSEGNGCLLATCTRDHRVSLYAHVSTLAPPNWKEVAVISTLHYKRLSDGTINNNNVLSYSDYCNKTYQLATI